MRSRENQALRRATITLTDLPLLLCSGSGLGIKRQGHLAGKDLWVGSVWEAMVDRVGMPRLGSSEKPFHGARSDGVVKEIL